MEEIKLLFILKRKKYFYFSNSTYISLLIIWLGVFICVGGIIKTDYKILSSLALIAILWLVAVPFLLKNIALYDDFMLLDYTLWKKKIPYEKVKYFIEVCPYIGTSEKHFMINGLSCNISHFEISDYEKFKNLLNFKIKENK